MAVLVVVGIFFMGSMTMTIAIRRDSPTTAQPTQQNVKKGAVPNE